MILFEYINRVVAWQQNRDRGASAVEYALLVGAIVAIVAAFVFILGGQANFLFQEACTEIGGAC
jgi:Flp pilus assembly pilin Flp